MEIRVNILYELPSFLIFFAGFQLRFYHTRLFYLNRGFMHSSRWRQKVYRA